MTNIADAIAHTRVPIFHGTRASLAEPILCGGFAPLPVTKQIEDVAAQYDVSMDDLMEDLKAYNRFAVVDARPNTAFVTGDAVKAGSWADRAPEATWEALWAVYRIQNPEIGWDWNMSDEGHLWVLAQRVDDPPAVLEARAPLVALRNRNNGRTAADGIREAIESGSTDALSTELELFRASPEWLVAPCDLTPISYQTVPMRVDHDLMLFMSGESKETFVERLRAGCWGEPGASSGPGDRPWHPFEEVWARLSSERQTALEEIVGTPITSRISVEPDTVA
ncbi:MULTISPECIES: hypothetical protein [Mycolicibacterium]|uniref:hypothetical protein n=1 Tax=Mycolicibacterium TaxID=1866885 RepID=UPI00056908D5|nr:MULTISPECIES: hypothetical protein [Mycolicibacterium]MCV7127385.1 hypothetical protein [Mycolicibacterium vanbaalenii PYR-1]QZY46242.1 hypothetical protein K5L12_00130 [Mycolicibacterium austroafricanum]